MSKRVKSWQEHLTKWHDLILKDGEATPFELALKSGSSIWIVQKLARHLPEMFKDIKYDSRRDKYFYYEFYQLSLSLSPQEQVKNK